MSEKILLPIGSVIAVDDSNNSFMIVGHMRTQQGNGRLWDYAAVPYPEGIIDSGKFFLFNHSQITRLLFIGMQDSKGIAYMSELKRVINDDPEKYDTEKYEE